MRTGRIDLNFRAVLFKLSFESVPHYFYYGAWPHDKAIEIARTSRFQINSVNGVLEVLRGAMGELAPERPAAQNPGTWTGAETQGSDGAESVPETSTEELKEVAPAQPLPAVTVEWENPLLACGVSAEDLVSGLGLDASTVRRAFAAANDDELLDSLEHAPEWQATALLELAAGVSIADVREKLALTDYVDDPEASEEEKIKKALAHPATRMQFTFVGDNPEELKQVIEGETLRPGEHSCTRNSASMPNAVSTGRSV